MTNFLSGVIIFIMNTSLRKEIYEHIEDAPDKCEDGANVLEVIVIKNA